MIVGYGTVVPEGSLPVYSVDTVEEARSLLVLSCQTNIRGDFVAQELVMNQTLENLKAFGDRLANAHQWMLSKTKPAKPKKLAGRKQRTTPSTKR